MSVKIIDSNNTSITIEVKIEYAKSMLKSEEKILDTLNEVGVLATEGLLKSFDTNGKPIKMGSVKMTSKGLVPKEYQTPYGTVNIERHVYQTSGGGGTFCPLDKGARIIVSSTPQFAKQISHKFAEMASTQVQKDLELNHRRHVSRRYLQNLADVIGATAIAKALSENNWCIFKK